MQMFRQQRREPGAGEPAADPRLLAAVQQMPTALLLCSTQRQEVLYANASMQELLARLQPHGLGTPEPLVGAALTVLNPDLARAAAQAGGGETQTGRLDFGAETVDYLISPVRDGGGIAALSVTCWLSTEQGQMAARFKREFKTVTERLVSNAGALRNGTREVTAMIETTRRDAEAVSGSANELNASIREICAHLVRASLVSQQAVDEARTSDDRIESLAQSAKAIGSIIAIINEIADHTNLLALNATIEAARAGPAGKGFAVVAQEVKTLAGQTAKATADIAAQVGAIQRASGEAVDITAAIRRTIEEVKSILAVISTAVEQQSAATREASGRLGQVSGLVSRSDAAAASLGHAAGEVDELALSLQTALDGFLDQVRRL